MSISVGDPEQRITLQCTLLLTTMHGSQKQVKSQMVKVLGFYVRSTNNSSQRRRALMRKLDNSRLEHGDVPEGF